MPTLVGAAARAVHSASKPCLQARKLLQPVGGCLVQVHMELGGRVSYGPYRAAGKALIQLLKRWVPLRKPPLEHARLHGQVGRPRAVLKRSTVVRQLQSVRLLLEKAAWQPGVG